MDIEVKIPARDDGEGKDLSARILVGNTWSWMNLQMEICKVFELPETFAGALLLAVPSSGSPPKKLAANIERNCFRIFKIFNVNSKLEVCSILGTDHPIQICRIFRILSELLSVLETDANISPEDACVLLTDLRSILNISGGLYRSQKIFPLKLSPPTCSLLSSEPPSTTYRLVSSLLFLLRLHISADCVRPVSDLNGEEMTEAKTLSRTAQLCWMDIMAEKELKMSKERFDGMNRNGVEKRCREDCDGSDEDVSAPAKLQKNDRLSEENDDVKTKDVVSPSRNNRPTVGIEEIELDGGTVSLAIPSSTVPVQSPSNDPDETMLNNEFQNLYVQLASQLPSTTLTGQRAQETLVYSIECPGCKSMFKVGDSLYRLPCAHLIHHECLQNRLACPADNKYIG